jgi:hypothetical protein
VPRKGYAWVHEPKLSNARKDAIAAECQRFIDLVLKPRFLPEIIPNGFNYAVGIGGKWRAQRYSFITRYRSGFDGNLGEEFDSPFTALDYAGGLDGAETFNLLWKRHTGQWWPLHSGKTLEQALLLIGSDGMLWPNP